MTSMGDLWVNGNMTATGNLTINGTIAGYSTQANMDLKAPMASPTFTGTATAAALTVSGTLLVGTTNVVDALGDKATLAQLALKTNVSRTTNSAVAWSEGYERQSNSLVEHWNCFLICAD